MLQKEMVAASTVPLVLSLLQQGESYGYALIQQVRETSGERITWTEGMLYPVLHWMEGEGLIVADWRKEDGGRRRRYYRITPAGRRALNQQREQWLAVHETFSQLWKQRTIST